jgi:hypothetical protein
MNNIITHHALEGATFNDFFIEDSQSSNWRQAKNEIPLFEALIDLGATKELLIKVENCSYLKSYPKYNLFILLISDFLKLLSVKMERSQNSAVSINDTNRNVNDHVYEM